MFFFFSFFFIRVVTPAGRSLCFFVVLTLSFEKNFGVPIEEGSYDTSTDTEIRVAERARSELQDTLRPHFIQRKKDEVLELPTKTEYVVWTHLSEKQRQLYEEYTSSSDQVQSVLSGDKKSPLEAITWLKKLCGHPLLVEYPASDVGSVIAQCSPDYLMKHSSKLEILATLLSKLCSEGHRVLVFSQSTKTLDIIQQVIQEISFSRIDGSTKEKDRQRFVDEFNDKNTNVEVMLLSTKAGGLGLTLTGADRAVVYDPSWNPAEDSQAVDRCYRIGQEHPVVVYRLVSSGTVEEKMYEKQLYKESLRRTIMTSMANWKFPKFNKKELRSLFRLAPEGECAVLSKLDTQIKGEHSQLKSHLQVVDMSCHGVLLKDRKNPDGTTDEPSAFHSPSKLASPTKVFSSFSGPVRSCVKKNKAIHQDTPPSESSSKRDARPLGRTKSKSSAKPVESSPPVQRILDQVIRLQVDGEHKAALQQLLDLLESGRAQGNDKMHMHKLIAKSSASLGWLAPPERRSHSTY